jgi:hypothetical protein
LFYCDLSRKQCRENKTSRPTRTRITVNSDVSLTVHFSITLAKDQLDAQFLNTFIRILYMYMFRAIFCSSSGDQIVLIQPMLSPLSVSDRPVHRLRKKLRTGRSLTESDDTRYCSKHVHVEDCNKCIKKLCIKLVIV